jgi:hypothetical protein
LGNDAKHRGVDLDQSHDGHRPVIAAEPCLRRSLLLRSRSHTAEGPS